MSDLLFIKLLGYSKLLSIRERLIDGWLRPNIKKIKTQCPRMGVGIFLSKRR